MDKSKQLYIDLLKKALLNELFFENGMRISYLLKQMDTSCPYDLEHLLKIHEYEPDLYESLKIETDGKEHYRERLFGFPMTMIGKERLENVETCIQHIISDGVLGDFMETGVWRGGCTIFMNGMLEAFNITDRKVWVADSFKGVPEPSLPQDKGIDLYLDTKLAIPLEIVKENFKRFGLLNDRIEFLPGWFEDTMYSAPIDKLALLRLDGDLYSSTIVVLEKMYPKLQPGGFIIVDDYGALESCRKAVTDFRNEFSIKEKIQKIDWTGVYWRKEW